MIDGKIVSNFKQNAAVLVPKTPFAVWYEIDTKLSISLGLSVEHLTPLD